MAGGWQSVTDAADCRSVPPFLSYGSKILIYYLIFLSLSAFPLISHFARRFGSVRLLISFFLPDPSPPSCHFRRQILPSVFSAFFQINFLLQHVVFFFIRSALGLGGSLSRSAHPVSAYVLFCSDPVFFSSVTSQPTNRGANLPYIFVYFRVRK